MSVTYTTRQVAERYGVSLRAVTSWINDGLLRAEKLSPKRRSEWRISEEALEEFDRQRQAASRPQQST